jgi:hypothetical protein
VSVAAGFPFEIRDSVPPNNQNIWLQKPNRIRF